VRRRAFLDRTYRWAVRHPNPAVRALLAGMSLSAFGRALGPVGADRLPPHADALTPAGRDELIRWLRAWGCRHLRVADHARTSRSLRGWASAWVGRLPRGSIVDLTSEEVARSADAYQALAIRPAAFAARPSGLVAVTFGQTAASKAMYALRPATFPPWDAPMRKGLALGDGAEGYARYLALGAGAIRAIARRASIPPAELPAAIGRPESTSSRLIDEYLWLALTRGQRGS
jgi:hypothetical protein